MLSLPALFFVRPPVVVVDGLMFSCGFARLGVLET